MLEPAHLQSDEELMITYYACHSDALEKLTTRYSRPLQIFFNRTFGFGSDDAQDLTQDTFLRIMLTKHEPGRFDATRARFKTWIYRIAYHVGIDEVRRKRRFVLPETDDEDDRSSVIEDFPSTPVHPIEIGETERFADAFGDCLEGLPLAKRIAFVLFYLVEVDVDDISRIQGRSVLAIRMLHQRAREGMRACLESKGYLFQPMLDKRTFEAIIMRFEEEVLIYIKNAREEKS